MAKFLRDLASRAGLLLAVMIGIGFLGHIHPAFDSFSHFRMYLSVAALAAAIVLFGLRQSRVAWVCLFAVIAAGVGMARVLPGAVKIAGTQSVVVVQHNLRFDNASPNRVVEAIQASRADFVVLQEVSRRNLIVLQKLANEFPYQRVCPFAPVGAVAVLSRYPISEADSGCAQKQGLVWVKAQVGTFAITVAGLHLHWPWPGIQHEQIKDLAPHFDSLTSPLILAGDFNAVPWSATVSRIGALTGTRPLGVLSPSWLAGDTTLAPWLGLPIDHIMVSKNIYLKAVKLLDDTGSDHLPLWARLTVRHP